jgi:hypothetical protein
MQGKRVDICMINKIVFYKDLYREKPPENYVFPNEMLLVSYNIII